MSSRSIKNSEVQEGDQVRLISEQGELRCFLAIDEDLPPEVGKITQGWWLKNGGVNQLTSQALTDNGEQAVYNDCFCRLEKIVGT